MSVSNNRPNVAYGISDALLKTPGFPIVSKRAPLTTDKAPIGQVWIYTTSNLVYILTSVVNNLATWILVEVGGGSGVFASVEATTGNITADLGNIVATAGSVSAGTTVTATTTVTAGTGITATTGNIAASSGNVTASGTITAGTGITSTTGAITASAGQVIAALTLQANGDTPGTVSTNSISGVVNTTQGAGALTILSPTATSHTNTGLIKAYVGATAVYIPYFANIS
jgi:hypothetical protein